MYASKDVANGIRYLAKNDSIVDLIKLCILNERNGRCRGSNPDWRRSMAASGTASGSGGVCVL
jgi:hypothetical protein